jgi:hypothetical protein
VIGGGAANHAFPLELTEQMHRQRYLGIGQQVLVIYM